MAHIKYISPERAQITRPIGMKAEMKVKEEVTSLLQAKSLPITMEDNNRQRKYPSARGTDIRKFNSHYL